MACYQYKYYAYTMAMLIGIAFQIIKLTNGQKETVPRNIIDQHVTNVRASDINYSLLEFRDPVPMGLIKGQKSPRAKRSIHREKIPRSEVAMESPYSSIVYISVGCIGTLVSPIHVLTAAHCIHDGVKIRKGHEMNRLRIGMLRPNGKQHKIRVKKIYVSKEIQPTKESRFAYDYAILKLNRPHRKPYLNVKAVKTTVRSLTFHVFERSYNKKSTMYKYTHCPVLSNNGFNYYQVLARDCPSSGGDSGAAVFESSITNSVIGIVSATAKYRSRSQGFIFTTVVLRLTEFDIARIKGWIADS